MHSVGSRVAANFGGKPHGPQGFVPGAGRGILAGGSSPAVVEPITPGPSQKSAPQTPAGRGRGRGVLLMDFD